MSASDANVHLFSIVSETENGKALHIMSSDAMRKKLGKVLGTAAMAAALGLFAFRPSVAHAEKGAIQIINRAGTSVNRGNLSRDVRYPTYSLAVNFALINSQEGFGGELSTGVAIAHSTFYTLNTEALHFPVIAKAPHQMLEASYMLDLCFFSYTVFRPCFDLGLSSVYLRHDAQNYQLYSAFPAGSRVQIVLRTGLLLEFGARIRRFSARFDGVSAWSQDVTGFVGMGIVLN
jgi:hypothetical protein